MSRASWFSGSGSSDSPPNKLSSDSPSGTAAIVLEVLKRYQPGVREKCTWKIYRLLQQLSVRLTQSRNSGPGTETAFVLDVTLPDPVLQIHALDNVLAKEPQVSFRNADQGTVVTSGDDNHLVDLKCRSKGGR